MIYPFNISLFVPGMPLRPDALTTLSVGGSETAGLQLARALSKKGHTVRLFCNIPQPAVDEKLYFRPWQEWQTFSMTTPHDISIVQRSSGPLTSRLASRFNILWCHDLPAGRQVQEVRGVLWNVDRIAVVSNFMAGEYKSVYGLEDEQLFITRNGIDKSFLPSDPIPRWRKRLVYAARPERGLDCALDIFAKLLAKDPSFELALCGYDNPVEHLKGFYAHLADRTKVFGDKVRWCGNLTKPKLYELYHECGIYFYPTPSVSMKAFREVSCISAMEAQMCGMPIVTSNMGALPETVAPGAGVLIDGECWTDPVQDKFVEEIIRLANDDEAYAKAQAAGRERADQLSWEGVADQWEQLFETLLDQNNESPTRLAHYFYKNNDIIPAKALLASLGDQKEEAAKVLEAKIAQEYAFIESPAAFAEHYRVNGVSTLKALKSQDPKGFNFNVTNERRFAILHSFFAAHQELKTILEYGCGHGWSTIYLANQVGRKWLGIDIDPGAVEFAYLMREIHAKSPDDIMFKVGDHKLPGLISYNGNEAYDCVLMSEVLEHCVDPIAVVEAMESNVKTGGCVLITVPYGPSEYGTPNWFTFRNHLWNFEMADLMDLFGKKDKLIIDVAFERANEATSEPVGFWIISYSADQKPLGKIDMARKFRVQRPRLTLSASLMAGRNCEETLDWCLKSVYPVADEIVIADTGMNDFAKAIAAKYKARLVPGADPLVEGFATPRNQSLDACRMDMVLWIDTDEKLLDSQNITKYLRKAYYNGYGIRQHHFSIENAFNPDMPVRLIRKAPYKGKYMRFYGNIHEHPEVEMNEGPGPVIVLADVNIAHIGYLTEVIRRVRFQRNHPLLLKDMRENPDRLLQKHFIIRDNCLLNTYEWQHNGHQVSPEMRARAQECVDLYRKYFLGKNLFFNVDSLVYYSQALEILGEGVDLTFDLQVAKDGVGDPMNGTGIRCRFGSVEEAEKELLSRLRTKMEPLVSPKW